MKKRKYKSPKDTNSKKQIKNKMENKENIDRQKTWIIKIRQIKKTIKQNAEIMFIRKNKRK